MGWKDAFRSGNTAGVNFNHMAGASAASSFGDAFKDIGKTIIAADAQAGKDKLLAMQLQNEQIKLDEAATKRSDTNTQEYAASMTRDAWGKDKAASVASLDTTASPEATLNAQQAINSFYTPTKEMKAEWTGQEKVVQDTNNKAYLTDAWNLDPTLSKEERKVEDTRLRGLYKPETAQLAEIEKRFKEQDVVAQTNFNNELREQATNFKTFADFQKSPDYKTLLTNADATGIEHVIDRYNLSDKQKQELLRSQAEIKHYQNADANASAQTQIDRDKLAEDKRQWNNPHATKDSEGSSKQEKDSKVVDAINKTMATRYGKVDTNGNSFIEPKNQGRATWVGTRAMYHAAQGNDASTATSLAERDYNFESKKTAASKTKNADPLGLR